MGAIKKYANFQVNMSLDKKINSNLGRVKVMVCHTGKNLNYSKFSKESLENRWEQAKNYQATLSVGGSSLIFMAYTGLEPYQAIGLLTLERDVLKIDELITPKKTSYTMSGEETSGNVKEDGEIKEAGRNKSDEITDSTEKAKESE